ncbi:MAG: hypothetical protein JNK73_05080 [Bacteroidia bacterium]|nr:hypothetical protein [Bacteroidia bacterium]
MKINLLAFFFTIALISNSQVEERSSAFPEPNGWCKLLLLKNTHTFYVEFTKNQGIKVDLYDQLRNRIHHEKLPLKLINDKLGHYSIEGIYEINGDVVMFYESAKGSSQFLIRIRIDGYTGNLKSEEIIAEVPRLRSNDVRVINGGMDLPEIKVSKDPESDYYAVIKYNTLAREPKNRIEVIHYNAEHEVINKANYNSPNEKYKNTRFLNAYVNKDDYVVIGTYEYNGNNSKKDEARFYVSQLSKNKTDFNQIEVHAEGFYKAARCQFTYNKVKKLIHMIIITQVEYGKDEVKYSAIFQNIDPYNLTLYQPYSPDFRMVDDYYKFKMKRGKEYSGMIQGTAVDMNGNQILLYQKTIPKYGKSTKAKFNNGGLVGTTLGDAALLTVTPEGETINYALFPANVYISGNHIEFNCNRIRNGYRSSNSFDDKGLANEQYFGLDLVTTNNYCYVLFNNTKENLEAPDTSEAKLVKFISSTMPLKYTLHENSVKKDYLFQASGNEENKNFCNFSSSDFDPSTKCYTTLVTNSNTKTSKIVWLKLE